VVSGRDLGEELRRRKLVARDDKVVGLEEALRQIAEWRGRGLRIGFTNGCFDLIHPGHVHLLAQAQAACDRLIVALNTDASVRRLKGPERPIQPETSRATVLSSLASVDLVVLFAGDTPLSLIEAIRPDILVKGADYSPDQVVGADIVRRSGGRVLLVDLPPTKAPRRRSHGSGNARQPPGNRWFSGSGPVPLVGRLRPFVAILAASAG